MSIVKICGITDEPGRDICLDAGADILGFNIYPGSKRRVSIRSLEKLITPEIREKSAVVGVDLSLREWEEIVRLVNPGFIQLHGSGDIPLIRKVKERLPGVKVIKKVVIEERKKFGGYLDAADFILCDYSGKKPGGSGKSFEWEKLSLLSPGIRSRFFVAGGITPENVEEALGYGVYGVDAATGSEVSPGKKSQEKVSELVRKVKNYEL